MTFRQQLLFNSWCTMHHTPQCIAQRNICRLPSYSIKTNILSLSLWIFNCFIKFIIKCLHKFPNFWKVNFDKNAFLKFISYFIWILIKNIPTSISKYSHSPNIRYITQTQKTATENYLSYVKTALLPKIRFETVTLVVTFKPRIII